jgi:hypothetical protein
VTIRVLAALKVAGMVLLVVVPGGSLILLAVALYRAHRRGDRPVQWLQRQWSRRFRRPAPSTGVEPPRFVLPSLRHRHAVP